MVTVEAREGRVHQLVHLHDGWQRVHVPARPLPDLGAGRGRQHRLDVNTFGVELEVEALAEE